MKSTLQEGDYLLVNKIVYFRMNPDEFNSFFPFLDERVESLFPFHPPRFGDIIVFHFPRDPSRDFVKRVIGVPGDEVEVRSGQVIRNGESLDEPYVERPDRGSMRPTIVPPDSYFVLGDNRRASNDSRDWGMVPAENIIGRAWVGYWPPDQVRTLNLFGRY